MQQTDYYPFGMEIASYSSGVENRYRYNGKEKQNDLIGGKNLDWYDYGARFYDPTIGRWHSIDPLAEKYQSFSTHHFSGNNPLKFVDLNGMDYNPIYDLVTSEFLGTDEFGLWGDAIIMPREFFTQGMSHVDAMEFGETLDNMSFKHAMTFANNGNFNSFIDHFNSLSSRPDWDGFVTIDEGIQWAKSHPGALNNVTSDNTLYLDASKLDFGNISSSMFPEINKETPINLLNTGNLVASLINPQLRATVYALGSVDLKLHNRDTKTVSIVNNSATVYDWNTGGSMLRNTLINAELWRAELNGNHGFKTYYYGFGKLYK